MTTRPPQRPASAPRPDPRAGAPEPPLYDPRFEHDACGVGFVADAGGRRHSEVLPLALAGLGSLAHRGAFAADGESSDGAGVSLPLEPALLRHLGLAGPRAGLLMLFLPADPSERRRAERLVDEALAASGVEADQRREVPLSADALGSAARGSMPAIQQLTVRWPVERGWPIARAQLDRRLLLARRLIESAALATGLTGLSLPSASTRSVVYKGLVAGSRLADFYPDLGTAVPLSYAVFHQRYATNTHPRWSLAQPFRFLAHNGEINTVRGNREQLRGRAASLGGGAFGRDLLASGPLLSADASDSLSLDEAVELLVAGGRDAAEVLLALIPEALGLRSRPAPRAREHQALTAAQLAPWDGPAALVFADGRRVGAMLDRNGLRPAAWTVTHDGLVAVASEAGAVPITAAETARRGRLGPGEMLLVEPRRGRIWEDAEAKEELLRPSGARTRSMPARFLDGPVSSPAPTDPATRYLAGLDAERLRLSVKTMALEGHEPLWSMGDDTPTPALARSDRPVTDHLRQSFAQVTNPPIDPERERVVVDLAVELGRRPALLRSLPAAGRTMRLDRPFVADLPGLVAAFESGRGSGSIRWLDATWDTRSGPGGLEQALEGLARQAVRGANGRAELLVLSDRRLGGDLLPLPSALAAGAVHTALTERGLRGRADLLLEAADVLDVHTAAMVLAAGGSAVSPWLALELVAELAGSRGAEQLSREDVATNLITALEKGLRKVLARMGISCAASYVGGQFFEALELDEALLRRCFPSAPAWPGSVGLEEIASRQLRRHAIVSAGPIGERLPDPGLARFRADGERHLYAPVVVKAIQALAEHGPDGLAAYRDALALAATRPPEPGASATPDFPEPATVRDQLVIRPAGTPVPLDDVEPPQAIARRLVGAAMSLGALSPEAHQAMTIGLQRIGGAANTGEGGEDPAWYDDRPTNGEGLRGRRDSAIKQVASARFGVTATYLARAEQLEIKIAQGSKPGEGGQLPGRKATPLIAALRRAQPGQSLISPPPHHDIYSIEDLAQLIADLRAINPGARIGVKLVAAIGVGTIAAGVAKAGADYIQISGHAGGTGASPLSSIKHAGIPWELGLAEAHQVLLRNGLRDRVALRTDGGLRTGRDIVMAALLGAEEFGFGTAALVALGCDMARQCHLDTCPTGVATQREDLRAKFTGTPEHVERFFHAVIEDVRHSLARLGARSVGELVGRSDLLVLAEPSGPRADPTLRLEPLTLAPAWTAAEARRAHPASARLVVDRQPASAVEARLVSEFMRLPSVELQPMPMIERPDHPHPTEELPPSAFSATITTADRSFGAHTSGLIERGIVRRAVHWRLEGNAGQSFGAFTGPRVELELVGQANDYVAKGLSGGRVVLRPEPELAERAAELAIAGNTCLYGATAGRLHVIGRAGIRFGVRNSGAQAVVEGVGPHACEYMTGGSVLILGPAGRNLGAGMTGGRAFLYDPDGSGVEAIDATSVRATVLAEVAAEREDGHELLHEVRTLLWDHAVAGSHKAAALLETWNSLAQRIWLIEPLEAAAPAPAMALDAPATAATMGARSPADGGQRV